LRRFFKRIFKNKRKIRRRIFHTESTEAQRRIEENKKKTKRKTEIHPQITQIRADYLRGFLRGREEGIKAILYY